MNKWQIMNTEDTAVLRFICEKWKSTRFSTEALIDWIKVLQLLDSVQDGWLDGLYIVRFTLEDFEVEVHLSFNIVTDQHGITTLHELFIGNQFDYIQRPFQLQQKVQFSNPPSPILTNSVVTCLTCVSNSSQVFFRFILNLYGWSASAGGEAILFPSPGDIYWPVTGARDNALGWHLFTWVHVSGNHLMLTEAFDVLTTDCVRLQRQVQETQERKKLAWTTKFNSSEVCTGFSDSSLLLSVDLKSLAKATT